MLDWSNFDQEVKSQLSTRGPRCSIRLMLDDLPADARAAVGRALADKGLTNSAIHRALRERLGDRTPSLFSVSNHRRGNCACKPVTL